MSRWRTTSLLLLFVAIADAATKTDINKYSAKLIWVVVCLVSWYLFSTSINDISDEQIDKINLAGNSERPLANSETNRHSLVLLSLVSAGVCLLGSIFISIYAVGLSAINLILSYAYSMPPTRISYRGMLATLMLPIGYVLYPIFLTTMANSQHTTYNFIYVAAGLYVSFVGRIILKDFRDVKGDKKFGKLTFVIRHGAKITCLVSAASLTIGSLIFVYRFRNWPIFICLLLLNLLPILYFLRKLSNQKNIHKQVSLVGITGRLANSAALMLMVALYHEIAGPKANLYPLLITMLFVFNMYTAYVLYKDQL